MVLPLNCWCTARAASAVLAARSTPDVFMSSLQGEWPQATLQGGKHTPVAVAAIVNMPRKAPGIKLTTAWLRTVQMPNALAAWILPTPRPHVDSALQLLCCTQPCLRNATHTCAAGGARTTGGGSYAPACCGPQNGAQGHCAHPAAWLLPAAPRPPSTPPRALGPLPVGCCVGHAPTVCGP